MERPTDPEALAAFEHWEAADDALFEHMRSITTNVGSIIAALSTMPDRDAERWIRRSNDLIGARDLCLRIFVKTQGGLTDEQAYWMTD